MVVPSTQCGRYWMSAARGVASATWWTGRDMAQKSAVGSPDETFWTPHSSGNSTGSTLIVSMGRQVAPVEGGVLSCPLLQLPLPCSVLVCVCVALIAGWDPGVLHWSLPCSSANQELPPSLYKLHCSPESLPDRSKKHSQSSSASTLTKKERKRNRVLLVISLTYLCVLPPSLPASFSLAVETVPVTCLPEASRFRPGPDQP